MIRVVGETCVDRYIYGRVTRLCPEAPVPVFVRTKDISCPGMAANVAHNVKALGVDAELITHKEVITKTRFVEESKNHMILRVDEDVKVTPFDDKDLERITGHTVIVSDYAKGYLSDYHLEEICKKSSLSFVDTKKRMGEWTRYVDWIKINEQEYEAVKSDVDACVRSKLIVTLGARGCMYKDKIYPAVATEVLDVTGAGDTFLAALAARFIRRGRSTGRGHIEECIGFANKCAAQVVQRRGTSIAEGIA